MIELKTENWYRMSDKWTTWGQDRHYIYISIPNGLLPLKDDYDINFSELGVRSFVSRYIRKSDFLKYAVALVEYSEVEDEYNKRDRNWQLPRK